MTLSPLALPVVTLTVAPSALTTCVTSNQHLPATLAAVRLVMLQATGWLAELIGTKLTTGDALVIATCQVAENVPSLAVVAVVLRMRLGMTAPPGV